MFLKVYEEKVHVYMDHAFKGPSELRNKYSEVSDQSSENECLTIMKLLDLFQIR
jgi:hypothetical protein